MWAGGPESANLIIEFVIYIISSCACSYKGKICITDVKYPHYVISVHIRGGGRTPLIKST
jgi:hypothetical protein